MIQEIKVPEIGENVESGVVVSVHIAAGDMVAVDDTVMELETDKALVEIPSPFEGRVEEVLAKEGDQIKVGDVIARVETEAGDADAESSDRSAPAEARGEGASSAPKKQKEADAAKGHEKDGQKAADNGSKESASTAEKKDDQASGLPDRENRVDQQSPPDEKDSDRPTAPAAPSIRRLARELGVAINAVGGSGPGGRISEADVKAAVRKQLTAAEGAMGDNQTPHPTELPDFSRWGTVETEAMQTVRRLTARSTAASWEAIPHVTQFDEADITTMTAFIEKNGPKVEKAGAKLTITAIITHICAHALKRFRQFNASIDVAANRIVFKRYVHIGIAVDTSRGLLVPVLRDADQKNIVDLAKAIGDLAERSRSKKIKPDELEGGTFTISNQGGIGGVGFTPIVMWPQVAILGVSRSAVKPVYVRGSFEPRTILPLALSYDHRLIDGADAARFLRWIGEGLEQPLTLFLD
ncbi:2-oxo acid dehydrogenase subunit E2 [Desulfosarcina sp.]|uniref:2-oxo acid dehydrogenase subunit E2 n=1 Tax=Desulfosarcina sp. TaxID=2027861 RepID=UPI0039708FA5